MKRTNHLENAVHQIA